MEDAFPTRITCTSCGFSLDVAEEDTEDLPPGLSATYRARLALEDHGWSSADDPALCSSCSDV